MTAKREVEMGVDYVLSADIREESVERGQSDGNSGGQRSAGATWRREKISGFDLDKLWVGGYVDVFFFFSESRTMLQDG